VDFNSDGKLDLVSANLSQSALLVHLGSGDGKFSPGKPCGQGVYSHHVASADLNLDGNPDLVVANYVVTGSVGVLLGRGDGSCGQELLFPAGKATTSVALADFDGDGRLDIAASNADSNNLSILLNSSQ